MVDQLTISALSVGGCPVVRLRGEVDLNTAGQVRDVLTGQVKAEARRVVVDLSRLGYIGSLGIHALLDAQADLMAGGGSLAVACPRPVVARVLELTGADQRIPVYGTVAAAVAARVECP